MHFCLGAAPLAVGHVKHTPGLAVRRSGAGSPRLCPAGPRRPRNALRAGAKCSLVGGGWSERGPRGGGGRLPCHRGPRGTNSATAGSRRVWLPPWGRICVPCCGAPRGAPRPPRPPWSLAGPGPRRPHAAPGPAPPGPTAAGARKAPGPARRGAISGPGGGQPPGHRRAARAGGVRRHRTRGARGDSRPPGGCPRRPGGPRGPGCRGPAYAPGGGQAARREQRRGAAAQALGGGAEHGVAGALAPPGAGVCTAGRDTGWLAFCGRCHMKAQAFGRTHGVKCITRSSLDAPR